MGVLNRVNDIIQANLSAALDKAEDPEKLLNLLVQEMQDALTECRATAATFLTQEKQMKREIAAKQAKVADWQAKAEKAALTTAKFMWNFLSGVALKHKLPLECAE